MKALLGIQGL